ncbi:MAG: ArsR family transcriptional regulator, partial [Haloarculaceae archaeon]
MRPTEVPAAADGQGDDGDFNTWAALQEATDTKRANLIADIVGHPQGAISVEELSYMNPDLSTDSIRRHLNTLQDVGVVAERVLPSGERRRDYPYKFYELTEQARNLFDKNGIFPEDAWERQYQAVEKTPRIRDVEQMPRPS